MADPKDEGHADHGHRKDQLPGPAGFLGRMVVVPAGQRENQAQLDELGGLDADKAQVQPVLRAGSGGLITQRRELDHEHHQDHQAVERIGGAEEPLGMHHG